MRTLSFILLFTLVSIKKSASETKMKDRKHPLGTATLPPSPSPRQSNASPATTVSKPKTVMKRIGRPVSFLTAAAAVLLLLACQSSAFTCRPSFSGRTTSPSSAGMPTTPASLTTTSTTTTSTTLQAAPVQSLSVAGASIATFYKAYPLVANFITCSIKASISDSLAQWRDVCTTKFSFKRNAAMMLYSGTILGILAQIMYNRIFPILFGAATSNPSPSLTRVVKMTLFDGFINAPLFWLPPAYIVQALLYNYPIKKALAKYWTDVRENHLLTKYWSLWIPVTFLNFSVVPQHFRITFAATVSFFWMIILSLAANKGQVDPEKKCPVEPEPVLLNPRALD